MGRGKQPVSGETAGLRSKASSTLSEDEKITLATYEEKAEVWNGSRGGTPDFWQQEINVFQSMLDGNKILDVGSGNARDASIFVSDGYDVTGVDISPSLLEIARRNCPEAEFRLASVYELPFEDNSFDGVWMAASLLHLPKNKASVALAEVKRVVKEKGVVFISVKKGQGEKFEEDEVGKRFFSYYENNEFQSLLEEAGFHIAQLTESQRARGVEWICAFSTI